MHCQSRKAINTLLNSTGAHISLPTAIILPFCHFHMNTSRIRPRFVPSDTQLTSEIDVDDATTIRSSPFNNVHDNTEKHQRKFKAV